ncbi:TauD/TfdA family dioxygenase [Sphingomonas antarctica]|uniref:TauD/TfdA family dioxygenase n=1 Tax=Sphingomonas antarctica TaxID=2040274 RepID=UPI0039EA0BDD
MTLPVLIEAHAGETADDLDAARLETLFREHGAILLRGFDADVPRFERLARRLCSTAVVNESPGRVLLNGAGDVRSVDSGTDAFNLHPELSREPWKPDAALFACLSPPGEGGETLVCDGVAVVEALPGWLRDALSPRRLVYPQPVWPELLDFWLGTPTPDDALLAAPPPDCPYSFRWANDRLWRVFSRPALHRPLFGDAPAFGNFLLFARFNNNRTGFPLLDDGSVVPDEWLIEIKRVADAIAVPVTWQQGDVLILDNSRYMHGRTAITEAAERRIATFFGYVPFAPTNPEEPANARWRRRDFSPPLPPSLRSA